VALEILFAVLGNDREGFTAFPPFQTERATFTALRFPVGPVDSERVDSSVSTEGRTSLKDHHLLSPLHPLPFILTGLPWRTFTLSTRLPHGVWLLRRLRPPSGTLAFSRPAARGYSRVGVPQFQTKIPATRSGLLSTGWTLE
jgi:hypothetical protein